MRRKRMRQRQRTSLPKRVGLAHYREADWDRWLETVDDRTTWANTYEAWHKHAEEMADRLRRAGLEVVWIDLDPDEFSRWCRSRGYPNDAEARSRFAAETVGNIPPPSTAETP